MKKEEEKLSGNELDDDDINEIVKGESDDPREEIAGKRREKSFWIKIGICLFLSLFAALFLYFNIEHTPTPENLNNETTQKVRKQVKSFFEMDSFVIPYNKNSFNYISFKVSFYIPGDFFKNEMLDKNGEIRDKIYESLRGYFDRSDYIPSPGSVKDIVLNEVNRVLSGGNINELYLMQFLMM